MTLAFSKRPPPRLILGDKLCLDTLLGILHAEVCYIASLALIILKPREHIAHTLREDCIDDTHRLYIVSEVADDGVYGELPHHTHPVTEHILVKGLGGREVVKHSLEHETWCER